MIVPLVFLIIASILVQSLSLTSNENFVDNSNIDDVMTRMKSLTETDHVLKSYTTDNSGVLNSNLTLSFHLSQQLNYEVVWSVHNFLLSSEDRIAKSMKEKENLYSILYNLQTNAFDSIFTVDVGLKNLNLKKWNTLNPKEYQYLKAKLATTDNYLHQEIKEIVVNINYNSKLFQQQFEKFTSKFLHTVSILLDKITVNEFVVAYEHKFKAVKIYENDVCKTCIVLDTSSDQFGSEFLKKYLDAVQEEFGSIPFTAKYDPKSEICQVIYNLDSIERNVYILHHYGQFLFYWNKSYNVFVKNCFDDEYGTKSFLARCDKVAARKYQILMSLQQQTKLIEHLFRQLLVVFKVNTRHEAEDDFSELQQFNDISKKFLDEINNAVSNSKPLTSFVNQLNRGIEDADHTEWMLDSIHHANLRNQKLEQSIKSILSTAKVIPSTVVSYSLNSLIEGYLSHYT